MKLFLLDSKNPSKDLLMVDNAEVKSISTDPNVDDGLMSMKIFGPIKDYVCKCGIEGKPGEICEKCGLRFEESKLRSERFGYIKMKFKILHPILFILYGSMLLKDMKKKIKYGLNDEKIIYDTKYIRNYITNGGKIKINNIPMFVDKILVIPPDFRKNVFIENDEILSEFNRIYIKMLDQNSKYNKEMKNEIYAYNLFIVDFYSLYEKLVGEIIEISKKGKLLREFLISKRTDFSARAVIIPNPELHINTLRISYHILVDLYKIDIISYLLKNNNIMVDVSKNIVEEFMYDNKHRDLIIPIIDEIIKDEVIMINRQPSLHRLSVLGFNIEGTDNMVIETHPIIVGPLAGDYDGDSVLCDVKLYEKVGDEFKEMGEYFIGDLKNLEIEEDNFNE